MVRNPRLFLKPKTVSKWCEKFWLLTRSLADKAVMHIQLLAGVHCMSSFACRTEAMSYSLNMTESVYFDWIRGLGLECLNSVDISIQPLQSHCTESTRETGACKECHSLGRGENGENGVWVTKSYSDFSTHSRVIQPETGKRTSG